MGDEQPQPQPAAAAATPASATPAPATPEAATLVDYAPMAAIPPANNPVANTPVANTPVANTPPANTTDKRCRHSHLAVRTPVWALVCLSLACSLRGSTGADNLGTVQYSTVLTTARRLA